MEQEIAYNILLAYFKKGSYLNITLNKALTPDMDRHMKNRITRIVYGTLQNALLLEYQLKKFVKKVKVSEKTILLIGLYEHYFMDIPDYAIVDELVNLAKKVKGIRTASFINAVLRNAFQSEINLEGLSEDEQLALRTSHPLWLVKMFKKQYGEMETIKILEADNQVPLRSGRVNTLVISRKELLEEDEHFQKGNLSEDGVLYEGGNIAATDAFKKGKVTIQDESSQMVARLLNPDEGSEVLDMCGAPGSKTTHLAALMHNTGHIDVYDLYRHKEKLIQDNIKRLHVTNITTHTADSTTLKDTLDKQYDAILLDGPCSGLGVLARKPEIKYHDSSAMDEIIPLQAKLLENAYYLLKNGGKMVYSTCTLNKKENEKQIENFIHRHPDMEVLEERTILPYQYHSDGFYMCLMRKR